MHVSSIQCPYCSTNLRIRDRTFVGQTVDCPDCGEPFVVAADGAKRFKAEKPDDLNRKTVEGSDRSKQQSGVKKRRSKRNAGNRIRSKNSKPDSTASESRTRKGARQNLQQLPLPQPRHQRMRRILSGLMSPLGISWVAAITAGLALLIVAVTNSKNGREKKATPADVTAKTGVSKTENAKSQTAELKSSVADKTSGRKPMKQPTEKTKPAPKVVAKDPPLNKRMPEFVGNPVAAVKPRNKLPPAVDVAAALAQPILRFQLTQRKPVRDLLVEVEEMAGVPIRYDVKKIAAALEMRISITLEKVTVRQILEAIVAKADLTYRIERDGIRVVPASQGGK